MKRNLFAVVIAALMFSACGSEDPANGVVVTDVFSSTATIEGVAFLNANTAAGTHEQFVPTGTQLVFTIANSEFGIRGLHGLPAQGNFVRTATVGANGTFQVTLPTRDDGVAVTARITGNPVVVNVDLGSGTQGRQVFTVAPNQEQSIVRGLTYQRRLDFIPGTVISEENSWREGTYRVRLTHTVNGVTTNVPQGTAVRITIAGHQFIPARANDLVLTRTVGTGGILEIRTPAPIIADNPNGLTFSMTSSFTANCSGSRFIFSMPWNTTGRIFGGETIGAGTPNRTINFVRSTSPID